MFTLHPVSSSSLPHRKASRLSVFLLLFSALFLTPLQANESAAKQGEYSGAMDTLYPDWFKVSFLELEEDVAEAATEGRRLMLLFHQDGCPYCNAFVERNLAQKDIEETLMTKFDVIEFDYVTPCPSSYQSENMYFSENSIKTFSPSGIFTLFIALIFSDGRRQPCALACDNALHWQGRKFR